MSRSSRWRAQLSVVTSTSGKRTSPALIAGEMEWNGITVKRTALRSAKRLNGSGLMKKTISIPACGRTHHVVSYYSACDAQTLARPSIFRYTVVSLCLTRCYSFRTLTRLHRGSNYPMIQFSANELRTRWLHRNILGPRRGYSSLQSVCALPLACRCYGGGRKPRFSRKCISNLPLRHTWT